MLLKFGNASSSGFSTSATDGPEFMDTTVTYSLANAGTILQGQVFCYDATNVPNSSGADKLVIPTSGNAGKFWGAYQGPLITNNTGATFVYTLTLRQQGYGVVLCSTVTASSTGSSAITVGAFLIIGANGTTIPNAYAGSAAAGVTVGQALATGTHTSYGATILAGSTAATGVVNTLITAI